MSKTTATFEELVTEGALEIGDGYRAKNNELGGAGLVFLRAAYLQDTGFILQDPDRFRRDEPAVFGSKVSQRDDVVITTKGNSTGRVGRIRDEVGAVYSPHLSYWRSRNPRKINQSYLYYWSQASEFRSQLAGMADSTDMAPYLSLRDQLRLRITLPPIDQQIAVGMVFNSLDDKIELNRRMNETLEAIARAIFRDWFVDFGPTRAKMEGRTAYLAPDLWSVFPDRLDHDRKPEGWEWGAVRDHLELKYGKSLPARDRSDGAFPVYGSGGKAGTHDQSIVAGPAIIVGRKGTVGSLYWEDEDCYPIDTVFYVEPRRSLVFCYELLWSHPLQEMNTDAAVPGLNRENVYRLELANPPAALINAFDALGSEIRNRIRANRSESRTLAETRDLLLPRLMSGEIRVRDAEKLTGGRL